MVPYVAPTTSDRSTVQVEIVKCKTESDSSRYCHKQLEMDTRCHC